MPIGCSRSPSPLTSKRLTRVDPGGGRSTPPTTGPTTRPVPRTEPPRQGSQLWRELRSVKLAAAALMSRYPDVPSIQAHRYAAGLSQDQAAARYNEVAEHLTTLGGTTINAWETWARTRGAGSPPP